MDDGFREQLEAAVSLNSPLGSAAIVAAVLHLLEGGHQELDGLYARLRDAEDARKAAVGVIQRQNEELEMLKRAHGTLTAFEAAKDQTALARVRALGEQWKYTGDRKGGPLKELLQALDA
jgi:hypothetical protein